MNSKDSENQKKGFLSKYNWIVKNLLMAVVLVATLFIVVNIYLNLATHHNKEIEVPDFTNMNLEDATKLADGYKLELDVTDSVYIPRMERGYIYSQNPKAGSKVKKGRRILITQNAVEEKKVEMPSLVGYSLRQAMTVLASKGLTLGKLIYKNDIATNNVLSQQYQGRIIEAGEMIPSQSVINLVLGLNPNDDQAFVPYVVGYKYNVAKDVLLENSFNIGRVRFDESVVNYSDSLDAVVYRQTPTTSNTTSYKRGHTVNLFLSKDPEKINSANE